MQPSLKINSKTLLNTSPAGSPRHYLGNESLRKSLKFSDSIKMVTEQPEENKETLENNYSSRLSSVSDVSSEELSSIIPTVNPFKYKNKLKFVTEQKSLVDQEDISSPSSKIKIKSSLKDDQLSQGEKLKLSRTNSILKKGDSFKRPTFVKLEVKIDQKKQFDSKTRTSLGSPKDILNSPLKLERIFKEKNIVGRRRKSCCCEWCGGCSKLEKKLNRTVSLGLIRKKKKIIDSNNRQEQTSPQRRGTKFWLRGKIRMIRNINVVRSLFRNKTVSSSQDLDNEHNLNPQIVYEGNRIDKRGVKTVLPYVENKKNSIRKLDLLEDIIKEKELRRKTREKNSISIGREKEEKSLSLVLEKSISKKSKNNEELMHENDLVKIEKPKTIVKKKHQFRIKFPAKKSLQIDTLSPKEDKKERIHPKPLDELYSNKGIKSPTNLDPIINSERLTTQPHYILSMYSKKYSIPGSSSVNTYVSTEPSIYKKATTPNMDELKTGKILSSRSKNLSDVSCLNSKTRVINNTHAKTKVETKGIETSPRTLNIKSWNIKNSEQIKQNEMIPIKNLNKAIRLAKKNETLKKIYSYGTQPGFEKESPFEKRSLLEKDCKVCLFLLDK